jgi:small subunit ribosomal protein S6
MVVMHPDIPEEDMPAAVERINGAITSRGGEVQETNPWGRRRLAYPINRQVEGNYVVTNIRLDPNRCRDLESSLMISEDVLRHLLIRRGEE